VSGPQTNFLPAGWASATLGDVCDSPQYGWTTSASDVSNAVKLLRSTDISHGTVNWETVPFCETPPPAVEKYQLHPGDIVITRTGAGVGNSLLLDDCPPSVFASYLIRFRPHAALSAKYIAYFLQGPSYRALISQNSAGIAQPNVNAKKLASLELPIAPRKAQDAIVAEIEKQFTRLDAAVAALRRVQANLRRYRATVLKAACEGRLVPTEAELARHESRPYESASVLLERTLVERRSCWDAGRVAKFQVSRTPPKDDGRWKSSYKVPDVPEGPAPAIAEGWAFVNLGQVTWSVKDGPHYSPKYSEEGVPFITGGQVRPAGVDFNSAKKISPELHAQFVQRCKPEPGDILYTKGGTTGIARVNTYDFEFSVWVHVAVLKLVPSVVPFYIQHALNSPQCYAQALRFTHGVGNQDLGLTRMVRIVFGLPPRNEQRRIVEEIDRRFSIIDELELQIEHNLRRAERLRQTLLKRAFEGNLVPQDPNDAPASVLLERIRSERQSKLAAVRPKQKRRKVAVP
jgi:type I restriction enzyme, S subunit